MQDLERELNEHFAAEKLIEKNLAKDTIGDYQLPSFLQMGSWIGGGRDGNPFVNGSTLAQAVNQQPSTAFSFYLCELDDLRRELSPSTRLIGVS